MTSLTTTVKHGILRAIFALAAAGGFFAAAAISPAGAQTGVCDGMATFHVFVNASGEFDPDAPGEDHFDPFNLNGSLDETIAGITRRTGLYNNTMVNLHDGGAEARFWTRSFNTGKVEFDVGAGGRESNLAMPGDLIAFRRPRERGMRDVNQLTARVYRRADGELALTPAPPAPIPDACADGLADNQFFLTSDWQATKAATTANQGRTNPSPPPGDGSGGGSNGRTDPPGGGSGGGGSNAGLIIGGAAVVGLLAYALSDGDETAFSFSPDFGYAATESGYSYKYGGRADFRKDAWSLYWTAGQRSGDGEFGGFRYESGGEYDGGFWRAAFSERAAGDAAEYRLSLSADWRSGIWTASTAHRFRYELSADGSESRSDNALHLEAALAYNRWAIRSAAGFRGRRLDELGDDARIEITAVRRF